MRIVTNGAPVTFQHLDKSSTDKCSHASNAESPASVTKSQPCKDSTVNFLHSARLTIPASVSVLQPFKSTAVTPKNRQINLGKTKSVGAGCRTAVRAVIINCDGSPRSADSVVGVEIAAAEVAASVLARVLVLVLVLTFVAVQEEDASEEEATEEEEEEEEKEEKEANAVLMAPVPVGSDG